MLPRRLPKLCLEPRALLGMTKESHRHLFSCHDGQVLYHFLLPHNSVGLCLFWGFLGCFSHLQVLILDSVLWQFHQMLYSQCPWNGASYSLKVLQGCFYVGRKGNVQIFKWHIQKYGEHCSREHVCSYFFQVCIEFPNPVFMLEKIFSTFWTWFHVVSIYALYPFQLTCLINKDRTCFVHLFLLPNLSLLSSAEESNPSVRGLSFTALFYELSEAPLNDASALSSQQRERDAYRDQRPPFPRCPSKLHIHQTTTFTAFSEKWHSLSWKTCCHFTAVPMTKGAVVCAGISLPTHCKVVLHPAPRCCQECSHSPNLRSPGFALTATSWHPMLSL